MASDHIATPEPATKSSSRPPAAAGFLSLVILLTAGLLMALGYQRTGYQVTLNVDGQVSRFHTHQTTVGDFLTEVGLTLHAEDRVQPPWDAPLTDGATVIVRRARPVILEVDGQVLERWTQAESLAGILQEANVTLEPHDRVMVNGQPAEITALLPWGQAGAHLLNAPAPQTHPDRVHIQIQRAVPVQLVDAGVPTTLFTTARIVGRALMNAGIPVYLADWLNLPLDTPVSPGLRLVIERSKPVTIVADGRVIPTRTRATRVSDLLHQEGVVLQGKDYTLPGVDAPVTENMTVQVVRVKQEYIFEEEPIPFQTVWRPDHEMELDTVRRVQQGAQGVKKRRIRVDYENGVEVGRELEEEWVEVPPTTEVWAYGTRIVIRELDTPDGPIRYWRKLRVLATSYTAATSGKPRDHPLYGITRLGWKATKGVIAVDPRVINFHTRIYVPGYGIGTAADTGGKIKGMRIDLGYDEDNLQLWHRWVDVYLLEPPPPPDQIRYRLPNYPRERRR